MWYENGYKNRMREKLQTKEVPSFQEYEQPKVWTLPEDSHVPVIITRL